MAQEKFDIIDERPVVELPAALVRRGARLEARKDKLQAQLKKLTEDIDAFEAELDALVPPELETDMAESVRIDEDGTLFQVMCKCVECQAELHSMTVVDTAEAMIRSGAVPQSQAEATREHAYSIARDVSRDHQTRMLFN
jgi:hypothetical protein